MAGRQRSAARGVKAGFTRLRRRRWSVAVDVEDVAAHLLEQRPLLARSNISAILMPGKVALFVRRKNVAASRSSTK